MSFFDNTKITGLALTIVGLLMIVAGILQIYDGATMDGGLGENVGYVIAGIGSLIAAVMYFLYGNKVRTGAITSKISILGNYVRVVGATTIVVGIFAAIGGIMSSISFWDCVIMIILGLIVIWIGSKIDDGKTTTFDKILWIVLLVVFVVLFIVNFIDIFTNGFNVISIISSLCYAIIYLFMSAFLLDGDVKKKMGM